MADAPLFGSANAALAFALGAPPPGYTRPLINRMAQAITGRSRGLSGYDGAAQAGMIRARLRTVGQLYESILIARTAPRSSACDCKSPCCAGHRTNLEWFDAIGYLATHARGVLAGCVANPTLRLAIVQRHFGVALTMSDIAINCDVARTTANDQNAKVVRLLRDEEPRAWASIDAVLRDAGIIGEAIALTT